MVDLATGERKGLSAGPPLSCPISLPHVRQSLRRALHPNLVARRSGAERRTNEDATRIAKTAGDTLRPRAHR